MLGFDFGMESKVRNVTLLQSLDLTKEEEQALLRLHGGRGVLLTFGTPRPARDLYVVVHGLRGLPADFSALADRVERRPDSQLMVFLYDDSGRYLERSAADLGRALDELRVSRIGQARLHLVAHSMGGIVARLAINELAQRFDAVELIAVDTPWHGFHPAPAALRDYWPVETPLVDMTSESPTLRDVNRQPLPRGASFRLVEADNREDWVRGLGDLEDDEWRLMTDALLERRALPEGRPDLRNMLEAFRNIDAYGQTLEELRASDRLGTLRSSRARSIVARVVPRIAGTHTSVLANPRLLDLIVSPAPTGRASLRVPPRQRH